MSRALWGVVGGWAPSYEGGTPVRNGEVSGYGGLESILTVLKALGDQAASGAGCERRCVLISNNAFISRFSKVKSTPTQIVN
jgi:hypothetical protein